MAKDRLSGELLTPAALTSEKAAPVPLNRRLNGPRNGRLSLPETEPRFFRRPARSLVTVLTELHQLIVVRIGMLSVKLFHVSGLKSLQIYNKNNTQLRTC
jgi:hypothetical protein